ncbi:unnamed protein product, partial [marine sediment metagenome]
IPRAITRQEATTSLMVIIVSLAFCRSEAGPKLAYCLRFYHYKYKSRLSSNGAQSPKRPE